MLVTIALVSLLSVALANAPQDRKPISEFAARSAPPVSATAKQEMEASLSEARARYASNPDAESTIWLGRRLAYLGRFSEAIELYTTGLEKFPNDARFYRHRGHRYITLRRFDLAVSDFEKAAQLVAGKPDEVEPDGQPNARNTPTSTLQFNIWYHLGLAYYLTGNNERALNAYRECLRVSKNPDALVATTHWLYMTLRRMNRTQESARVLEPVSESLDVIENAGYHRLVLMYKGLITPAALLAEAEKQGNSPGAHSILYGIGNWHLYNRHRAEALNIMTNLLKSDQWTSFGYIAAESDVQKLGTIKSQAKIGSGPCEDSAQIQVLTNQRGGALNIATLRLERSTTRIPDSHVVVNQVT